MFFRNATNDVRELLKIFSDHYSIRCNVALEDDGTYNIDLDDCTLKATVTLEEVTLKHNTSILELHIPKNKFYKFEVM